MKAYIEDLFADCGITLNGSAPWDIQVLDERWYGRLAREGSLGLGESYMDRWWTCTQIDAMMARILGNQLEKAEKHRLRQRLGQLAGALINMQTRARARKIATQHYDLDNELFFSFLDDYKQYSCAYFKGVEKDKLAEAQENKLYLIATKLNLKPGEQLLDIGCGWGGLARFMAERRGCEVLGINISEEQLRYARDWCRELPVHFENTDYRSIRGRYDKIVSVGMFEHVGDKNYRTFMKVAHRCLKDGGSFLLHTIGGNRSKSSADPWIRKYIFCNSMLPSAAQIARAGERLFIIEDWHSFGHHYDTTLMAWHRNFQKAWPSLKDRYDERFKRMWDYYLLSCAGAFRSRSIQLWQILLSKHDAAPNPPPVQPDYG
jgi:cyclopropane-fatty-acyl-phospholipid synthase